MLQELIAKTNPNSIHAKGCEWLLCGKKTTCSKKLSKTSDSFCPIHKIRFEKCGRTMKPCLNCKCGTFAKSGVCTKCAYKLATWVI